MSADAPSPPAEEPLPAPFAEALAAGGEALLAAINAGAFGGLVSFIIPDGGAGGLPLSRLCYLSRAPAMHHFVSLQGHCARLSDGLFLFEEGCLQPHGDARLGAVDGAALLCTLQEARPDAEMAVRRTLLARRDVASAPGVAIYIYASPDPATSGSDEEEAASQEDLVDSTSLLTVNGDAAKSIESLSEGAAGRKRHQEAREQLPSAARGNPFRQVFLEKLRHPKAVPVVREIKRLIHLLAERASPVQAKADAMQESLAVVRRAMQASTSVWRGAPADEIEGSIEAMEAYVISKTFPLLMQPADSDDVLQDRLFGEKVASLHGLSLADIMNEPIPTSLAEGVSRASSPSVAEPGCAADDEVEKKCASAMALLARAVDVGQASCPRQRLSLLLSFVREAAECPHRRLLGAPADGDGMGADRLLPTVVWVIVRARPAGLISTIRYIQRFRDRTKVSGEHAYCLTNLIAAITTIERLYGERIAKAEPIYSMLASALDRGDRQAMPAGTASEGAPPAGGEPPTGSSDLSNVATTFLSTIGFVPRAISSAVADTFRSRSIRSSSIQALPPPASSDGLGSGLEEGGEARQGAFGGGGGKSDGQATPRHGVRVTADGRLQKLRYHIMSSSAATEDGDGAALLDTLTVAEVRMIVADYRAILLYNYNK